VRLSIIPLSIVYKMPNFSNPQSALVAVEKQRGSAARSFSCVILDSRPQLKSACHEFWGIDLPSEIVIDVDPESALAYRHSVQIDVVVASTDENRDMTDDAEDLFDCGYVADIDDRKISDWE
jgi:hypothetical protein